jgi:hypothetical protein
MLLRPSKRELIASGTALALLLNLVGPAAPRLAAQDSPNAEGYEIEIIKGANMVNSVKRRVASETIVEVHDRNRKPVAGVILTFTLPQTGAGGTFTSTGSNIATVVTGPNGQAAMPAFQPTGTGPYNISVSGQVNGSQISTQIPQSNQSAPTFVHSTGFKVLMVAALAGAAAGTYFAIRGSNGGATKTTVTPGTPSIGPARIPGSPR